MARELTVQFLRGTTAQRTADTPAMGEPVLDTTLLAGGTTGPLFVGDGVTAGGKPVSLGAVASVFTRTGAIVAANGDYTASNITNVPAGNLASADVQGALNELQGDVDNLTTLTANDFLSGTGVPAAGLGQDGYGYLNRSNGDIYAKAAGAWTLTGDNAYAQLGLSAIVGAAPTAAGAIGTGVVAARSDHSHRFQTALETPSTASGIVTATNVDAAIAQLATALAAATAAAITTWVGLTDTPGAITALNIVRGNAGGTALEMVSILDAGTL